MNNKPIKLVLLLFIAVLSAVLCSAKPESQWNPPDERVYGGNWPEPNEVNIPPEELAFHHSESRNFENESIFFLTQLDTGWVVITQLFVWRYGPITGWGIYALVAGPNGERYWTREQLTEKNVRYSTDKLLFQQGKNFVEIKNGVIKVIFDIKNFSCNLTFKNKVPSWKPGHGYAYFTDKKDVYQYMAIMSPWADVTGTVTLPDRTLEVNGQGYADKSRTNLFPTKINPFIIDWRTFSPPGTPEKDKWSFTMLEFVMHPSFGSRRIPILLLCHDGKIVMATKHYDLELLDMAPGENTKYEYPQRLTIKAQDGDWKIEGEFKCGTLFDFTDIFAEMPAWIRKIAEKFMSRPVFFRSFGEFSGKVYMPDGAVEEIKLVGSTEYVIFK